jgi:hypothetical protein
MPGQTKKLKFRSREWAQARLKEVPDCPIATRIVIATETADGLENQRDGLNQHFANGLEHSLLNQGKDREKVFAV